MEVAPQMGMPSFGPIFFDGGLDAWGVEGAGRALRIDELWTRMQPGVRMGCAGYMQWRDDKESSVAFSMKKNTVYVLRFR